MSALYYDLKKVIIQAREREVDKAVRAALRGYCEPLVVCKEALTVGSLHNQALEILVPIKWREQHAR